MQPYILLIHYDQSKTDTIIPCLMKEGYVVSSLRWNTLPESVEKIIIDVVLADITEVSFHNTYRFLRRLRLTHPTACVILTGEALEPEETAAFLRAGVFDFLKNPFSLSRMKKTIRQGLKNRERLFAILQLSAHLEEANQELKEERDRLKLWGNELSRLNGLSQSLSEPLNVEGVIQSLEKNLNGVIPYDIGCLYLGDLSRVWISPEHDSQSPSLKNLYSEALGGGPTFFRSNRIQPDTVILQEENEIILSLASSTEKLGVLRLIRPSHKRVDDYQLQILSMLRTSLILAIRNAETYRKVEDLAVKDGLTEVLNRRAFMDALQREFRRSNRHKIPLSMMLIDIDYFKKVNDIYGHLIGDKVLQEVVLILKKGIREIDVLARYGGEEFAIILPETHLDQALSAARRILKMVEDADFNAGEPIHLTVSIGVSSCPAAGIQTQDQFFDRVDKALYMAKQKGRNRIETPATVT